MIELLNIDCMKYMETCSKFDLAICDFEYGINVGNMPYLSEMKTTVKQKNGTRINGNKNKTPYTKKDWDKKPPPQEYFNKLKEVTAEQILFGIEYINWDGVGIGRIKWNKGFAEGVSFNKYETAYCSMIDNEIEIPLLWAGMMQAKSLSEPMTQQGNKKLNQKRIHPTEKPILLYIKLILDYAKKGYRILDTHGGSMSIAIAVDYLNTFHGMNLHLTVCEIDKEYYDKSVERYNLHKIPPCLF